MDRKDSFSPITRGRKRLKKAFSSIPGSVAVSVQILPVPLDHVMADVVADPSGPSGTPSLCGTDEDFTLEEYPSNQIQRQQQLAADIDGAPPDSATPESLSSSMSLLPSREPSLTLTQADRIFIDVPDDIEYPVVPLCFAKICRYPTGAIEEEIDELPVGAVAYLDIATALQPLPIVPMEQGAPLELPAIVVVSEPGAEVVFVPQKPIRPRISVPHATVRPDIPRPQPITEEDIDNAGGLAMRDSYTTRGHQGFKCKLCSVAAFRDRQRIRAHFLAVHVVAVRNPLECSRCFLVCPGLDDFNKHIQTRIWCTPRERILNRGPVFKTEAADLFPGFLEVLVQTVGIGRKEVRCMNPKSHSSQSVCGHVVNDSDKMWTHTIRDHLGLDCWLCQNCHAVFDTHRLLNKHYKRGCVILNAGEVEDFVPANGRMAVLKSWYAPAIEQYTALPSNGGYIYSCGVEGCDFSHISQDYMVGHLLNKHLRASPDYPTCRGLDCPLCSRSFASPGNYYIHRNRKTPCSLVFNMEAYFAEPAFAELRTHVTIVDTEKWSDGSNKIMFRCSFADCSASYPKMSTCIRHIVAMHRPGLFFVCPKAVEGCRLGPYNDIQSMQIHYRMKHDASKHTGIAIWRDDNVLVNIPQDGTTCGVCSMFFATDELRWRHQLFCHTTMTAITIAKSALPCTKAYYDACTSYKLKLLKHLAENVLPAIHGNPFQLLNTNNMLIWSQESEQGDRPIRAELQILLNMRTVLGFVLETDERMPLGEELAEVGTEILGGATNGFLSEDTVVSLTAVVVAAREKDVAEDGNLDTFRFPQGTNEYLVTADTAQIWANHDTRNVFITATGGERIIFLHGEQGDRTMGTQVCYSDFIACFLANRLRDDLDPFIKDGGVVTKSLLMLTIRKHLPAMVDLIPLAWIQQGYATLAYQPITPAVMMAAMGQEAYDAVDLTRFDTER